jgi:hypothetical protein
MSAPSLSGADAGRERALNSDGSSAEASACRSRGKPLPRRHGLAPFPDANQRFRRDTRLPHMP